MGPLKDLSAGPRLGVSSGEGGNSGGGVDEKGGSRGGAADTKDKAEACGGDARVRDMTRT